MKRPMTLILIAAMTALFAGAALAHDGTPGIDRREARQQLRIAHGARSGALTRAEARRLRMGERHIRRMERRARADGVVSFRERVRIHRALDRESLRIHRLGHNARGC